MPSHTGLCYLVCCQLVCLVLTKPYIQFTIDSLIATSVGEVVCASFRCLQNQVFNSHVSSDSVVQFDIFLNILFLSLYTITDLE